MLQDELTARLDRLGVRKPSREISPDFVSKVRRRRWGRRLSISGTAAAMMLLAVVVAMVVRTPERYGRGPSPLFRGYGIRPNIDQASIGGGTTHEQDRVLRAVDGYRPGSF